MHYDVRLTQNVLPVQLCLLPAMLVTPTCILHIGGLHIVTKPLFDFILNDLSHDVMIMFLNLPEKECICLCRNG